ncbi:hypothetical protein [Vibrio aestuarianus]|uniref:Uncharacterized protein n=1 Tax=Vibrio aestuarianus TaxID=28171 RepID=A0ABN8TS33_9VIBR|nr:hypothetical protein [Vibrio aestuarianus]MDE1213406.1 hypothetical protein [Vibrio aestuarianus]MDE1216394.1 hypothetical protein [Vibrio aestuarianus]MDE1227700.1 hypothetical protein [Vibrio aestuarianus]MDE1256170.1 hypothetical protein [Vibrio aestuarianus]MDE1260527.1 hypothetical protein [Vibrio aestuarianus]
MAIISLDWNGSHGQVSYQDKYTLLWNKPKLSFEFVIIHYVKGDEVYPNGFKTGEDGQPIALTLGEVQEVETYCQLEAKTTWADLCSIL